MTNPKLATQTWTESVTCTPPSPGDSQRCFSDHGEALQ